MEITLQYFDGCPNWAQAAELLEMLAKEQPAMTVSLQRIVTQADAEAASFSGSPSFFIEGRPLFEQPDLPPALACRVYRTPAGLAGSPTIEQFREAITAAEESGR